ncbi:MAG: hypothetical protein HYR73_02480, partial [Candidatus Eisenbacteria bacterium]|nr:hypothetical protein [Candidatus Eisenbacteria bacterium]
MKLLFPRPLVRAAGVALLAAIPAGSRVASAQYSILETRDLRLVYHAPTLGFVAPYTTQCFENSLRF